MNGEAGSTVAPLHDYDGADGRPRRRMRPIRQYLKVGAEYT